MDRPGTSLPHLFVTVPEVLDAVAMDLTAAAERAVERRGRCVLALGVTDGCLLAYRHWARRAAGRRFWTYTLVLAAHDTVGPPGGGAMAALRDGFLTTLPDRPASVHGVDRTLPPDAAAAAYERTLRMALELRPSEPPPFDRVVLELSPTGRLGALDADDWERADDARLARPAAVGDPGVVLTPLAIGAARSLLVLALGGVDPRPAVRSGGPGDDGAAAVLAALDGARVRTALYATVPPPAAAGGRRW
jgi:hypothetical protein